jgi:uncharacterized phage infection (PIP) family protein YhgE
MGEIVESVRRVTDIMGEIMAASGEQTTGIEQINQAIIQMDQVTQQNASLVEEAAAASEAMQDQASQLAQVVSVFKTDAPQGVKKLSAPQHQVSRLSAPKKAASRTTAAAPRPQRKAHVQPAAADEWETF